MKIPGIIYLFLLIELIFVALIDFKTKKISNLWSIINLCFFVLTFFIFPEQYLLSFNIFLIPVCILIGGFGLYLMKIMGAGDSKYLFTFFLLTPLTLHETAFVYLAQSTIIIGLCILTYNSIKNFSNFIFAIRTWDKALFKQIFGSKFTYAPVILFSWMWLGWEQKKLIIW
jgi:prepilin peptidase CpaA